MLLVACFHTFVTNTITFDSSWLHQSSHKFDEAVFFGRLPLDQSDPVIQRQQNAVDPGIVLAEDVESPARFAVFCPVRSDLFWELGVGFRRNSHATCKNCMSLSTQCQRWSMEYSPLSHVTKPRGNSSFLSRICFT